MKVLIDGQTLSTQEMGRGVGQVFRRLLEGMVVPEISHDWLIAVHDPDGLRQLNGQTRKALQPVILPPSAIGSDPAAVDHNAYGQQLQAVIDEHGIDVYWNPNPLMVNVRYPFEMARARSIFTFHDLIPLRFPDLYLNGWPESIREDYLARLADLEANADAILAVSEASKQDLIRHFPRCEGKTAVVHHAPDCRIMWPYWQGCALSDEPYVLYVGGFDPRKNMVKAVQAFAQLVRSWSPMRRDIRFKLVCAYGDREKADLLSLAEELGVEDLIELTGFVDDEELGRLFRNAHLFFFPSLYEGFGMPLLDALACGVPVVASSSSSIPEVCGAHATYCDPDDVVDMATKLRHVWDDREADPRPRLELVAHARSFQWKAACGRYLESFERIGGYAVGTLTRRRRVAYLSPWPPQRSGVADYSYALVAELKQYCDLEVFAGEGATDNSLDVPVSSTNRFRAEHERFDAIIYHIGNNPLHADIYELAWDIPGVVVLHDYNIHPVMRHSFLGTERGYLYRDALLWYGETGRLAWQAYQKTGNWINDFAFPMSHALAARSRAVIVHSRWVARQFPDQDNVFASHLGTHEMPVIEAAERSAVRARLGLESDSFYVGVFGFVNLHKRVESTIAAVATLIAAGYPVNLVLVGEVNDPRINVEELARGYGVPSDRLLHTSYVDAQRYVDYMKAVDLVVNLRYPTMGESSASLFNAFSYGAPTIVSNVKQFAELPDAISWKVDVDGQEVEQLVAYVQLLCADSRLRQTLGTNAREFVARYASFARVCQRYLEVINHE